MRTASAAALPPGAALPTGCSLALAPCSAPARLAPLRTADPRAAAISAAGPERGSGPCRRATRPGLPGRELIDPGPRECEGWPPHAAQPRGGARPGTAKAAPSRNPQEDLSLLWASDGFPPERSAARFPREDGLARGVEQRLRRRLREGRHATDDRRSCHPRATSRFRPLMQLIRRCSSAAHRPGDPPAPGYIRARLSKCSSAGASHSPAP